ncbi:hypothetical protein MCOR02_000994 [Pyricularia oryzae]|uniref:Neutral protease 2 homolog MGG_10927 n=6 Tax=Pyricularia TaxID=48558 RepID=NPIIA_PYRO7|nr:metallo-endopeptidase [Pyricularia oryzae 70-15]Q2KH28.1 RecName: Full=Neutral protease 2 homolog MGG_10927; AltName: Full=Deuterolysin MGG_10927; Flags: Precursor [Pyricularia oryzae 70-15]ELQ33318.1 metallo-endopeptidase [Pyricularia oryzae Y34]KAH9437338.1 hypothetical protein MCOR02_000994 [Pyricularia oryzae]KAI6290597.1 hypothetical protein MCOR33_011190 [Pyricularia grisea]EAQ70750.1 hypothetical protein MGCH7_ch7g157 [Pyricularia oryzae 70-15]KAI6252247.1 hypothetical protein MCOR1
MKYSVGITALLATLAQGAAVMSKRDIPLDVKIQVVNNSEVKASITNSGSSSIKVVKTGSILDSADVEKSVIMAGENKVAFDGIRYQVATAGLPAEAFQIIEAGETIEVSFNVASTHDFAQGGDFDIAALGTFSVAESDSGDIFSAMAFESNHIKAHIDGTEAAKVRRSYLAKRTMVQSDCTGTRLTQTTNAINSCRSLAQRAASAAQSNSAKMNEYFKSTSSSAVNTVVTTFNRIASECNPSGGASRQYCTDQIGACSPGVIAYTVPSQSIMVNCPTFFTMPTTSNACRAQTQDNTILHEVTHLSQVKGTQDYNCYGYTCMRQLTSAQNLNHADTYTLFAQAIKVGC